MKEVIAIDRTIIDKIIENHDVLNSLKRQIMQQPLEKPLSRLDFNILINNIDKLSHPINKLEQEIAMLESEEAEKILKDA